MLAHLRSLVLALVLITGILPPLAVSAGEGGYIVAHVKAADVRAADLALLSRRCQAACAEVLVDGRHAGSAWFASADGVAVTAAHLFHRRQPAIELLFADNRRTKASLVAVDRGHDVALLQADGGGQRFAFLPVSHRSPGLGEELLQYGAPVFRSGLIQPGRVASVDDRFEFIAAVVDYAEVRAVAAMMQGGTSGGPWLNAHSEVVGVQSSVLSLDGHPAGVAFFAEVAAIRRLMETRRSADTPTPGLGVDELWQQAADYLTRLPRGAEGLVASVVRGGGPAAKAGIEAQDLIVTAAGQRLIRIADLPRAVRRHSPGTTIDVKFLRPGETAYREARVVLERAEDVWPAEPAAAMFPTPGPP
jgi:S1-C subfamily serine protease